MDLKDGSMLYAEKEQVLLTICKLIGMKENMEPMFPDFWYSISLDGTLYKQWAIQFLSDSRKSHIQEALHDLSKNGLSNFGSAVASLKNHGWAITFA